MSRRDYRSIRSIMETPIMDERKWAKVAGTPVDMLMVDLEDSVTPHLKETARERVTAVLRGEEPVGDKVVMARPNHLSTPWGHDDVVAFAEAGVECMAYPKINTPEDLLAVKELLAAHGADPDIVAIIETPGAMVNLAAILAVPGVVSVMFGPGDISSEVGIPLLTEAGDLNPVFASLKPQVVMATAALRLGCCDIVYAPDLKDLDEYRRRALHSKLLGFTTLSTFYPPHVEIINEILTPTVEEVARAQDVIERYEAVRASGAPAALGEDGRPLLIFDYDQARTVLARSADHA